MADLYQIPGELNLHLTQGDDAIVVYDFDIVLTGGYSFSSLIEINDGTEVSVAVSGTYLASGVITAYFTDAILEPIPVGDHKWYLMWTISENSRRVLGGKFELVQFPP